MNVRTFFKYLPRGPQDPKSPGRHRVLDETLKSELATIILQAFNEGKAMRKRQILALVRERYSPKSSTCRLHAVVAISVHFKPVVLSLKKTHVSLFQANILKHILKQIRRIGNLEKSLPHGARHWMMYPIQSHNDIDT
jgi:hypothetical protein